MPATNTSGNFFDTFADTFDTFYDGKRSPVMQWVDQRFRRDMFERFRLTFERMGDLHGKTVLDIGCGSGPYIAEALHRGAAHVTGIDPAPRMLELARERAAKQGKEDRVTLLEGYFPDVQPEERHDLAIVMGVLDYVPEPAKMLRAIVGSVNEGAVISFPSTHWLRTPVRKVRYDLRKCPVWFYSREQIEELARQSGAEEFRLRKIDGAGMDYVLWLSA
jgi:2-polyprenyl-3-methyl-5-hydroxy-6-metoxy-1,4-benzoquinol methylase